MQLEQFANQRRLFQPKFTQYWSEEIEACRNNPRQLWQRVDELLQAPQQNASAKLTAGEFADFFHSKLNKIRASTAAAPPPVITERSVPPLSSFHQLWRICVLSPAVAAHPAVVPRSGLASPNECFAALLIVRVSFARSLIQAALV